MRRRDFLISSAAGTAFLGLGGLKAFSQAGSSGNQMFCFQSERKLPVVYQVDVVVVGGSTAGVAAAVKAAQSGAEVFLAAQEPYLGDDLCATYRYWREDSDYKSNLETLIFSEGLPTPMYVKRTLDQQLIDNNIGYLYSSYVTDIITDENGQLAGVVISNRSGRQAVLAKVIIDATPRAMVARMTTADFSAYPAGKQSFKFTVVGNNVEEVQSGLNFQVQPVPVKIKDKSYPAIEYSLDIDMKDGSWASFAEAEQKARDLTWTADQVECSDMLFQVTPDRMNGLKRWSKPEIDIEKINIKVFQPRKVERIFVLSSSADLGDEAAANLMQPGALIPIGERVGEEAATMASQLAIGKNPGVKGQKQYGLPVGDIGELLEGLRPSLNQGFLLANETSLPVFGTFDAVVMGAGTAGAPAALGAARQGASTLVLEYMHGMGGIGTLGMVGRYYHGYREGFTNEVDKGVKTLGGDNPRQKKRLDEWVFDWKTEWFRSEIRKAKGQIWFGVLGCGAYVENGRVKGVVVATPFGKGVVLANTIIDSTGSSDIAIAAGAAYVFTDAETLAVQGTGLPFKNPDDFYNNSDWTFSNDSDMLDVWRTFIVGKNKFKEQYDIGKLIQTRERRRMVGDFTISVLDVYNGRTYPDTISIHQSSFDTHGFTVDPYFALKPPAHSGVDVTAYVPIRALLPKGLEGIIVTGLGASAHRDAMPVIRMQPCLQNQGYAVGIAAAMVANESKSIRNVNIKKLQQKLVSIGSITPEVITDIDNYPPSIEAIQAAAKKIPNELEGLETVLWDSLRGLPVLSDFYHIAQSEVDKLVYARILGMYRKDDGYESLLKATDGFEEWDKGWNYTGMGQFGMSMSYIDSVVIALGNCKKPESVPSIIRLAKLLTPESHFSHFRAVAIALETIGDETGAKALFDLLQMKGVTGHAMTDIKRALELTPPNGTDTSTRNNSLRELVLGRALFKCGDYNGMGNDILQQYSKDLRGHYYLHATGVLKKFRKEKQKNVVL